MVLVRKWPILPTFPFSQYGPGKCLYDILKRIKAFQGYKKKVQKEDKIDFFPKGLAQGFG